MLFDELPDEELAVIVAEQDHLYAPRAYNFVRFTFQLVCTHLMSQLVGDSEVWTAERLIKYHVSGQDVLSTLRYISASFYGALAPNVFVHMGVKKDEDVRAIALVLATRQYPRRRVSCFKALRAGDYTGATVTESLKFERLTHFDTLLANMGVL